MREIYFDSLTILRCLRVSITFEIGFIKKYVSFQFVGWASDLGNS